MSHRPRDHARVLAIDPTTRGFGFVVLEGPERLIDWGVAEVRTDKLTATLRRIEDLLDRYEPTVLVTEEPESSRRCARVRELLADVARLSSSRSLRTRTFSRWAIRRAFASSGAVTKQQIAAAIAERFPELAPRLPAPRKAWMTEAEGMSVFDAAALALTFLHRCARRPSASGMLIRSVGP